MKFLIAYAVVTAVIALIALLKGKTVTVSTEWKRGADGVAVQVPLVPRATKDKCNPLWWFGNDEISAENNSFVYKYLRNIAQNWRWYVVGVADRVHKVTGLYVDQNGNFPNKRSDMRPVQTGLQVAVVWAFGFLPLPYVSVSWRYFTAYAGWEPKGGLGFLLNLGNSDIKNRESIDAAFAEANKVTS
jgi:hypothetical protein